MTRRSYILKRRTEVAAQFRWAAVKKVQWFNADGSVDMTSFDIWTWNLFKRKWTRMSNHGCGFGSLMDCSREAGRISDEVDEMFEANRNPPAPL